MLILAALSTALWLGLLAAPWQPWRCRERLEPDGRRAPIAGDFTVLIPARNEAAVIRECLVALRAAAAGAPVVVVDDQSDDGTGAIARGAGLDRLVVVAGTPPPQGWTGKLWALQQGLAMVATPRVLLLDADIRLAPDMIAALQHKAGEGFALVSVCAEPCWRGIAARWLMPAFVYFFKLLYPFALANRPGGPVAAAAGGVILVDRGALADAGGFSAWRGAIIDDCTLAANMKRCGHRCWLGLTHGARSLRRAGFVDIVQMVARTAYVQLRESPLLLLAVSAVMMLAFWIPVVAVASAGGATRWLGAAAWLALAVSCVPTLVYYRRQPGIAFLLPLTATVYLAMSWYSAWRALRGTRSVWKRRRYQRGSG
jgi:hopene-associated glycosyltransferase HpnB